MTITIQMTLLNLNECGHVPSECGHVPSECGHVLGRCGSVWPQVPPLVLQVLVQFSFLYVSFSIIKPRTAGSRTLIKVHPADSCWFWFHLSSFNGSALSGMKLGHLMKSTDVSESTPDPDGGSAVSHGCPQILPLYQRASKTQVSCYRTTSERRHPHPEVLICGICFFPPEFKFQEFCKILLCRVLQNSVGFCRWKEAVFVIIVLCEVSRGNGSEELCTAQKINPVNDSSSERSFFIS